MVRELVLFAPMSLGCVACLFDIVLTAVTRHQRRPLPNYCVYVCCSLMIVYTLLMVAGNAIYNWSDYHSGTWDDFVGGIIVAVAIAVQNAATFLQLGVLLEQSRQMNPPKQGRPSRISLATVCRILQFASIPAGLLVSVCYFLQSAVAAGGDTPAARAVNSFVMLFVPRIIDALFKIGVLIFCFVTIREKKANLQLLLLPGILVLASVIDSIGWSLLSIWDFVMSVAQIDDDGAHNIVLLFFASIFASAITILTGIAFFPKLIHEFREKADDKVKIHGKTVLELQSAAELNDGWDDELQPEDASHDHHSGAEKNLTIVVPHNSQKGK